MRSKLHRRISVIEARNRKSDERRSWKLDERRTKAQRDSFVRSMTEADRFALLDKVSTWRIGERLDL